jgi:hypothetical protein
MHKVLIVSSAVIGAVVLSAIIFGAGMFLGRTHLGAASFVPAGMMNQSGPQQGFSRMGSNGVTNSYRSNGSTNVKPLSIDQAKQAVKSYLAGLNNPDLELKEIMIFDNNAYARITEKSSGLGAMELLVDPASLSVYPEFGPNMMWNLKYGHMNGSGMMGGNGTSRGGRGMMGSSGTTGRNGMRGGQNANPGSVSAAMTVTPEQAVKIAQEYLNQQFPGYQASTDADPFYGYYTIDILKDGKPTGMLSVNGFSGQVYLHTWHGTFIEMWE